MNTRNLKLSKQNSFLYSATSEKGTKRTENQDRKIVLTGEAIPGVIDALFLVADGMGGNVGGGQASQLATDSFVKESLLASAQRDISAFYADRFLEHTFRKANKLIHAESLSNHKLSGMGTTCTALVLVESTLYIGHVGDSRAYLLRDGKLLQLTRDHSWVGEQIYAGNLSPEQAKNHPKRSLITRGLGILDEVETDLYRLPLYQRDMILVCSDGISSKLNNSDIRSVLCSYTTDMIPTKLLEKARSEGSTDDATAVVGWVPY